MPGRPTDFNDRLAEAILEFAKTGATDRQIARKFGFNVSTLYAWKARYRSFADALKESKDLADDLVELSLFRRATGYQHPDVHFSSYEGIVTATKYTKVLPPDTTACIFWLKNRRKDKWRDVYKHEPNFNDDAPIAMAYDPGRRIEKPVTPIPQNADAKPASKNTGALTDGKESGTKGK